MLDRWGVITEQVLVMPTRTPDMVEEISTLNPQVAWQLLQRRQELCSLKLLSHAVQKSPHVCNLTNT